MALYAIGDLHLSLRSNKPMEIFGDAELPKRICSAQDDHGVELWRRC